MTPLRITVPELGGASLPVRQMQHVDAACRQEGVCSVELCVDTPHVMCRLIHGPMSQLASQQHTTWLVGLASRSCACLLACFFVYVVMHTLWVPGSELFSQFCGLQLGGRSGAQCTAQPDSLQCAMWGPMRDPAVTSAAAAAALPP
jgi:hypothetical protein